MIYELGLYLAKNIGDKVCNPSRYFDFETAQLDFMRDKLPPFDDDDLVIFGGGCTAKAAASIKAPNKIAWGIGSTSRDMNSKLNHDPSGFIRYGSRDCIPGLEWVPCSSCMSPLFDDPPEPTRERVYYGHAVRSPMNIEPSMQNNTLDFEKVIRFLASGETVVSSSYHGVYWGMLLGRKVVAVPFGAKFMHFRNSPAYADHASLEHRDGVAYPEMLERCRIANLKFYEKVKEEICSSRYS